jgi:RelE toxin of RelE / RelB toxin-antitoxin system
VELIETSVFTRQIGALLTDEEYREFQAQVAANPVIGDLIRSGGGIRKVRVAAGSKGKRGGARVIYYWAVRQDLILFLLAYPKSVTTDLTPKQVAELARIVKEEFRT